MAPRLPPSPHGGGGLWRRPLGQQVLQRPVLGAHAVVLVLHGETQGGGKQW